ncbi:MAG TPA: cupin domain-containing protein [Blastocatellia bacterium]|nr:cupin domain-containing protein [Blastocatellia bacterium]
MSKSRLPEQLDEAVEAVMASPEASIPELDPRIAALIGIAGELRHLPSPAFKAALKATLLSKHSLPASPSFGKPVSKASEIDARLKELAEAPGLVAYDVRDALKDLPPTTMRLLASLDQYTIGVSRYSTQQPLWERHPAGDELLHILDGAVEVTTLTDQGPVRTTVRAGSVFVCPRDLWHWPRPVGEVSMLFLTAGQGTKHSRAKHPPGAPRGMPGSMPMIMTPREIGKVLNGIPELNITSETTGEEANAAVGHLGWLGDHALGVMRYSGQTPWERHPDGDELLHALDGEVDVTVLTDDGPVRTTVGAGSVFVCPRGLWHRQNPKPKVTMLFATPIRTTEVSFAYDPRRG